MNKALLNSILAGILVTMGGGCRRAVQEPILPVAVPETFSVSGTRPMVERWWEHFDDGQLNGLVDEALGGNFDLQAAWDRLAQAEAVARRAEATVWPWVDWTGSASTSRRDAKATGTTETQAHSLGLAAGYEVDLWGELASTRRAAWLDVEAQQEAVDTAAITISASVAATWYQLAEARAQVRIAQAQIVANKDVLEIVTVQFRNAVARAADVLRQRQLVASTESQLIAAQETVEVLQYRLAALLGRTPELAWGDRPVGLADVGELPAVGLPTEVLWRRPDVRQGYRQLQAADQRLAAAIADQYPRLSLSAGVSTFSGAPVRDLFRDWLTTLAANVAGPVFDAGLRKAEVERQRAIVSERVHTWSGTVLKALAEVETALSQERQQAMFLSSIREQLELARQTYERNRESFMKGQVDYIRVLESLQSLQALERSEVTARRTLIGRRIDLYRATAGSWDKPRPGGAGDYFTAEHAEDVKDAEDALVTDNRGQDARGTQGRDALATRGDSGNAQVSP
ncbi:MAG TPA: TolC family protein [Phycisphaerales bacterium]|nr:TolC family protein [Phycisphaerales bacterium]